MRDNDHVPASLDAGVLVPQAFPKPALDAIANHSISHPATDSQSDPGLADLSGEDKQHEVGLADLAAAALNPSKVPRLLQSHLGAPGEPSPTGSVRSHGERADRVSISCAWCRRSGRAACDPWPDDETAHYGPPGVLIRARKPWLRLRLMLLGW